MQLRTGLLTATTTLTLLLSAPGYAGIKCWTNHDGIRECGNEVPAEYAQGRTETINKRGMTTEVEERAMTAAELAEAQRKAALETGAAAPPEDPAKIKAQAAYDRMLLASYLTEEDIAAARNRKLSAIDASIELTKVTTGKLEEKLTREEQKAAVRQQGGKALSADEQKDLDSLKKQIADKKHFIEVKLQERDATNSEYDGYLQRFRELKAPKAP